MRLLINLIFLFTFSPLALASTNWYVRDGGGTQTQCTGTTNAVYSGSGSGQPCAYNHPAWVIGGGDSGSTSGTVIKWVGGDTLYIDGDSDINVGQQAQYMIGYGMPNSPSCQTTDEYNCRLITAPAGTSSNPTQIIGTGSHKPQLWGGTETYEVLVAQNNYINLQWLEVTDHYACAYEDPTDGCNGNLPYGSYGIVLGGTGINLTDVYAHGLGVFGIVTGVTGTMTFTRVWSIGNGYGGINIGTDGTEAVTGTLTFNQPIVEWNGCVEAYPLTYSGIDNPLNYSQCFGQGSGGYGDGLAFGATGSENPGSWNLIGPGSISFNTQDGLDIYHGTSGVGTVSIDKMRFEGNAGQQVKVSSLDTYVTNNIIIGTCGWWYGAPQSLSGGMQPGDSCRSDGCSILFGVTNNGINDFYNNTVIATGLTAFESLDGVGAGCNAGTQINLYNNIVLGGYDWYDNSTIRNEATDNNQVQYYYADGDDGNGGGTCGSSFVWTEDYNLVSPMRYSTQCIGTHDKCSASPSFITGTFPVGTYAGAQSTYYTGQSGVTLVNLGSSSSAIGAGVNGLTYWNTENDYYNVTRSSPPSIGGLELNSCAPSSYGCQYNSSCCNNSCSAYSGGSPPTCGGSSCTSNGGACSVGSTCCSGICNANICSSSSCTGIGGSCSTGSTCCSGICCSSLCANSCGGSSTGIITQLTGQCSTSGVVRF